MSMRRLSQFLVLEEREDNVGKLPEVGIEIKGASFYWPRLEKLVFAQAPPPNQASSAPLSAPLALSFFFDWSGFL